MRLENDSHLHDNISIRFKNECCVADTSECSIVGFKATQEFQPYLQRCNHVVAKTGANHRDE